MGNSTYSHDTYAHRVDTARSTHTDYFTHTADIQQGRAAAGVHEKLNPASLNRVGLNVRESRDSAQHPVSTAIAVLFDVTGSMSLVPRTFVDKLGGLMRLMNERAYVEGPQILFGAIGDATCDCAPLQLGQYEAGNEMDEALSLIYLEGRGGGQNTESYELGMYYMARHAGMDCLEKRGKKGYLFLMGDELPYSNVKKNEVQRVIGDTLQESIPLTDILRELREKFEVYWILPGGTANWNDREVNAGLQQLFGQNLIKLENPDDICELIAATVGVSEGHDIHQVTTDLNAVAGSDSAAVERATGALGIRRFNMAVVPAAPTATTPAS